MRYLLVVAIVVAFLTGCNQPSPLQPECVKHTYCANCLVAGCGWCDRVGCFSFKSDAICVEPVGFVNACQDGTAPFPSQVIDHPYLKKVRDGGVADGGTVADGPKL